MGYLQVKSYPFSEIALDKNYFRNKNVIIINCYTGSLSSDNEERTVHYLGKVKNEDIYFYVIDDPKTSGYGCGGSIKLYYSDSIKIIKDNNNFSRQQMVDR